MTTSYWRLSPSPRLITADALVVGAGIAGVSAALALERRGLSVAVIERHAVAGGASGRAAGFLMRGAAENYAAAIEQWGRETARTIWRWTEENLRGLRSEGIESLPSYRPTPSCLLALEPSELDELRRSAALLGEDGFNVGWADRGEDAAWTGTPGLARSGFPPLGGLLNPDDGSASPYELVRFLSSKLKQPIHEHAEVAAITSDAQGLIHLHTADATFAAPRAILCTNAYLPLLLPHLSHLIAPRRGQMLALRHPRARLDCSYYANHGYEYFRQTPDGTIVVGGQRRAHADTEVGYEDRTTGAVQGALESFACAALGIPPEELRITARWAGTMGFSPDGLPLIGPLPGPWPEGALWFCSACTGHGMSLAHRTAAAAAEAMLAGAPPPFPLSRVSAR
ncbi:MAG: FAD-binding oxidoreductase [Phycisphaerales bacterium]